MPNSQGISESSALNLETEKQKNILKGGQSSNAGSSYTSGDQILNLPAPDISDAVIQGAPIDGVAPTAKAANSRFNPFNVFRYSRYGAAQDSYDVASHNDESLFGGPTSGINSGGDNSNKNLFNYIKGAVAPSVDNIQDFSVNDYQRSTLNPTANRIIEWSRNTSGGVGDSALPAGMAPTPYAILDFLHCTHYGKIPNNRLVTVRRYPNPTEDNLKLGPDVAGNPVPLAQALSWYGEGTGNEIGTMLPISWDYKWNDLEAKVNDITGNEVLVDDALAVLGVTGDDAQNVARAAVAATQNDEAMLALAGYDEKLQDYIKDAYNPDGPYWNRVLGPVNVINKSRKRDRGMGTTMFGGSLKVNFSYTLRSFQGQNPKTAFLDLLTNFLTLTYNTAPFWGGGYRYFQRPGVKISSAGSSLIEQGKILEGLTLSLKEWLNGATGVTTEIIESLMSSFQAALTGGKATAAPKLATANSDGTTSLVDSSSGITSAANALLAGRSASLMQKPMSYRSLLEGRPIGDMHMVIGNPMNPMATVGNLVISSCDMKFGSKLGADDFPTEIKFNLEMKHGRPRAKQDIESIFNLGNGAMSFSQVVAPSGTGETFKGAPIGSEQDKQTKPGSTGSPVDSIKYERLDEIQDQPGAAAGGTVATYRKRVTEVWGDKYGKSAILESYIKKSVG